MIKVKKITMYSKITTWLLTASLFSLSIFSTLAFGAEEKEEEQTPWYQVEVLVFTKDSELAARTETWRDRQYLNVHYPPNIVDLNSSPLHSNANVSFRSSRNNSSQAYLPFQTVADRDQTFRQYIRKLQRQSYRTLYHQAWRQPVEGKEKALPILVQGGRQFGDYFELEGSVTIRVSRYLHIDTQLWLTDYVEASQFTLDQWWEGEERLELEPYSKTIPLDDSVNMPLRPNEEESNQPVKYAPLRTVMINESRRMRSGELHYLDHPLFGVLVRVVPVEEMDANTPNVSQLKDVEDNKG